MRKNVLIIANLFYASPRIPGITKYLPDFGWQATVLSVPVKNGAEKGLLLPSGFEKKVRIVETPYKGDIFVFWRKIFKLLGFSTRKSILGQAKEKIGDGSQKSFIDSVFNLYETIFGYPDEEKKWKKPALKTAIELLEKEKFDAVISSSSPVTTHAIANLLKKKTKIPWVADFRDLWTQNHNYPYFWIRKIFETRLEKRTLSSADALITVSDPWRRKLEKMHKRKSAYTVTNGFDPEEASVETDLTDKFTITYTGQIYSGKQDPTKIMAALKSLILDKKIEQERVELRFYGPENNWLGKKIEEYGLSKVAKQYGKMPREISLQKQKESQVLLLLNWESEKERGVYTGKIFEYLASRRPIISTGGFGGDVVEDLIRETKTGAYAVTIDDIKEVLERFYSEYKRTGKVSYNGDVKKINQYSYQEAAKKIAGVLDKVT